MPKAREGVIRFQGVTLSASQCVGARSATEDQGQQSCGVASIFQGTVLLPLKSHAGQLQRGMQSHRTFELAGLGKALLEVAMLQATQMAVQSMLMPFLLQLSAIIVAPTGPGCQV